MRGIVFHTLRGSPGWSSMNIERIDVSRVSRIGYQERLFTIFDKDKPNTLNIEYYFPETQITVNPVMGGKGGFAVSNTTILNHPITKRYETEEMVLEEIWMIQNKIRKLDKYTRSVKKKLRLGLNE